MKHFSGVVAIITSLFLAQFAFAEEKPKFDIEEALQQDSKFRLAGQLLWVTSMTELTVTEYAIENDLAVEENPLMQKRAVRIVSKVGATFLIDRLTKYHYKDHPKAMFWLRMGAVIAFGTFTGWNFSVTF